MTNVEVLSVVSLIFSFCCQEYPLSTCVYRSKRKREQREEDAYFVTLESTQVNISIAISASFKNVGVDLVEGVTLS